MAKAVASATAALVMTAKETSDICEGKTEQNRLVDSARQCGMATSQLVACTKVLAPTLASSPECQEQFAEAVKQVASFVDDVVETAEVSCALAVYNLQHWASFTIVNVFQNLCMTTLSDFLFHSLEL